MDLNANSLYVIDNQSYRRHLVLYFLAQFQNLAFRLLYNEIKRSGKPGIELKI